VGGNTAIKRVVKLTAAGAVVPDFKAVPNTVVNEVVVRPVGSTSVERSPASSAAR
jgi:hypothetical protein